MRSVLLALILTTTTFGCGSKADKAAPGAVPSAAAPESGESEGAPRTEKQQAEDKATEALSARGEDKTEALIAKEAADAELAKAHQVTQDKLQADFDAVDRRFNALKGKTTKAAAKKASADVAAKETIAMANIAKLRDATGASWDATKAEVEANIAALAKAVDAFEASLK
jgi:hypothetical protein